MTSMESSGPGEFVEIIAGIEQGTRGYIHGTKPVNKICVAADECWKEDEATKVCRPILV
jgi:hypothetical protein